MSNTGHKLFACGQCAALNRIPDDKNPSQAKCGKCGRPVLTGKPIDLNANNFSAFTEKSTIPVLIDFWAAWCGPCRMMAPVLEQAATQLEPRIRIGKVDTENQPGIAAPYNIRSIPTLVLMKNGREISRISGAMALPQLINWLNQNL